MPPLVCPRCQRSNPDSAHYCHFDGTELRSGQPSAGSGRLHQEFVFPSGKRCATFDELAEACQDDWGGARELLRQGAFVRYFSSVGRMDLARAAQESMGQSDADMGLSNLVGNLPLSRTHGPRLDLTPRRLVLGTMLAGETKQVSLVVNNQGQGMLQGTLTVAEGGEWLRIQGSKNGQCGVRAARDQLIVLNVDTRGLAAGQAYGARLTVITNGGVVEVPARLDLSAHPFTRPPFQGVRAYRELAERMLTQRKAAAAVLESGEIGKWFESNGWSYPVRGVPAKGVAGVQQFFECLGLSRPPTVRLSQTEAFHTCKASETTRGQVILQTPSRKWVYGNVESDAAWLRVLTPQVSGPQQAQVTYEIDGSLAEAGTLSEGNLTVAANGGQKLGLKVRLDVQGRNRSAIGRFLQPVLTCAVVLVLLRLLLFPVVDVYGRSAAANAGLAAALPPVAASVRPSMAWGGWLGLPWTKIYLDPKPAVLKDLAREWQKQQSKDADIHAADFEGKYFDSTRTFRDFVAGHVLRVIVACTWWLGAVLGVFVLWRRGSVLDAPWGLVAGTATGIAGAATVGALILAGDLVPHVIWDLSLRGSAAGFGALVLWGIVVTAWWILLGVVTGLVLTALGPVGRLCLHPFQCALSSLSGFLGMAKWSHFFAPL
jgi:hypothetical protein